MKYTISGETLPVVLCELEEGESIVTERGGMSWMTPNLQMETSTQGGLKKAFGRKLSGEAMFQNRFTAVGGPGQIAISSSFPGAVRAFAISPSYELIAQRRAFLASEPGVTLSAYVNKKLSAGLFGGEGLVMQRLTGNGVAFLEIDGSVFEYTLKAGESLLVSTGYLAAMEATCTMELQDVPGFKNMMLGGESLFHTKVTGPGKVFLQSIPVKVLAGALLPYLPTNS